MIPVLCKLWCKYSLSYYMAVVNVVWITNMNNIWIIFRFCYGQNVCILWRFVCWSLNPQGDGIWRRGLWEVVRVRLSHEDGALMMRLVALEEEEARSVSLSAFTHEHWKGHVRTPCAACKPGRVLTRTWPRCPPTSARLPAYGTVRDICLLFKSPSLFTNVFPCWWEHVLLILQK